MARFINPPGQQGPQGPQGPQGEPGEDAAFPSVTSFAVQGGTTENQPTFSGDPLFYSNYVRMGDLVHFNHKVEMSNITDFGTGQYYMTLPFNAAFDYTFRQGCLHDASSNREYHISGEVEAGSNIMYLYTTDVQFAVRVYDFPFTDGEPINLTTSDSFHIGGTYIAEPII